MSVVVPVINIGCLVEDFRKGEIGEKTLKVCSEIQDACRDVGFFYVSEHQISLEVQKTLEMASEKFFSLPEETKRKFSMQYGGKAWRGWFRLGDELTSGRPDQKEGYYFGTELSKNHPLPLHGANLFPDEEIPGLRTAVLDYMECCSNLAQYLLRAISIGLLGKDHSEYFGNSAKKRHIHISYFIINILNKRRDSQTNQQSYFVSSNIQVYISGSSLAPN